MITKWKVFNFKSIQKETELDCKPLTILAGANSSGKSTLIQSILLIAQTLSSKIESKSVVLNGLYTKLGQFTDVRSYGSEADQVLIGWEWEPGTLVKGVVNENQHLGRLHLFRTRDSQLKKISCQISFDIKGPSTTRELSQLQPNLFSCLLSTSLLTEEKAESKSELAVSRSERQKPELDMEDESVERGSFAFNVSVDEESLEEIRYRFAGAEPVGCTLSHFFPALLTIKYNRTEQEAREIISILSEARGRYLGPRYRRDRSPLIPSRVLELLKSHLGEIGGFIERIVPIQPSFFPEYEQVTAYDFAKAVSKLPPTQRKEALRKLDDEDLFTNINDAIVSSMPETYKVASTRLPRTIMESVHYMNTFFSQGIRYLGPLREEPRSLYPLVPNVDPTDVGLQGEYTASVLNSHKTLPIKYIPPEKIDYVTRAKAISTRSLEAAVIDWLRYMEIAETVETHDRGKHGHEMKVTTSGTSIPQDLPHVGVGVSQVLPILVMCLLAKKDTTLIIEQPELHLHPLVQTRLADFFISMALLGKQCIIETHSEYLINRLRLRIVSDPENALSSISKVYFSEKGESGHSSFREVVVNEFGAIPDWPKGFFDQSQFEAEEILRAAAQKRRLRREDKNNA